LGAKQKEKKEPPGKIPIEKLPADPLGEKKKNHDAGYFQLGGNFRGGTRNGERESEGKIQGSTMTGGKEKGTAS